MAAASAASSVAWWWPALSGRTAITCCGSVAAASVSSPSPLCCRTSWAAASKVPRHEPLTHLHPPLHLLCSPQLSLLPAAAPSYGGGGACIGDGDGHSRRRVFCTGDCPVAAAAAACQARSQARPFLFFLSICSTTLCTRGWAAIMFCINSFLQHQQYNSMQANRESTVST